MASICDTLERIVRSYGYIVHRKTETATQCLIDFRHPNVEPRFPMAYFLSSLVYDKERNHIEVTVRSKPKGDYKELYLNYCCENGEMACRPHVWFEEKIVSVEAKFHEKPIEKLKSLLSEML